MLRRPLRNKPYKTFLMTLISYMVLILVEAAVTLSMKVAATTGHAN